MELDLLFLSSGENSSTKSLILKSLIAHQSLTNVRIQSILRKEFNKKISYQAIRQALSELTEASILEKKSKEYSINSQWFQKARYELSLIEKSLEKRNSTRSINKDTTEIRLKNLYELGHFVLYSLEQKYFDVKKNTQTIMKLDHLWIPFIDQVKRERLKEIMIKNKIKVLVKNKTTLDKLLSRWYRRFVKVKFNKSNANSFDLIVNENTTIQIYMSQKLKSRMNKFYSLKGLASFSLFNDLSDMTYENNEIQIIIIRNKNISDSYREQFEKSWKI